MKRIFDIFVSFTQTLLPVFLQRQLMITHELLPQFLRLQHLQVRPMLAQLQDEVVRGRYIVPKDAVLLHDGALRASLTGLLMVGGLTLSVWTIVYMKHRGNGKLLDNGALALGFPQG